MPRAAKIPARNAASSELTRNSLELLLDLVEIKLGCLEVVDREDVREFRNLSRTRDELASLLGVEIEPLIPPQALARARQRMVAHP